MEIKVNNIDVFSLSSLLISERQNLPQTGGIYFVINTADEIIYIGQAQNLKKRWNKHECAVKFGNLESCRIAWLEISDENQRLEIERDFLLKFEPLHNVHIRQLPSKHKAELKNSIKIRLRAQAQKFGIKNAYQLMKFLNETPDKASRLWSEDWQKVDLGTLSVLCHAFQCTPNDLLEFQPDSR